MSDAEKTVEEADEADPEEASHEDPAEPDAEDLPTPDAVGDLPDPEEVEADAGADADTDEADEGADADADTDEADEDDRDLPTDTSGTVGEMYVNCLVALTNALIDKYGTEDSDHVEAEAAKQFDVDHHMNRLMEKHGLGRELPPGQAVALSSTAFVGSALLAETDAAEQMLEDIDL
ncbi:MAG: hypothetical protein ABEH78_07970 [Haloferacaceae archaeon]